MKKTERNSNVELLRILLMIFVILLHFNNKKTGGAFNLVYDNSVEKFILYFLESFGICAVNCFMIILGYFLAYNKKVKLGKALDLVLIVIFYRVFDYIISVFLGFEMFSVKSFCFRFVPVNYFAVFYIVTYIFSPFLVKLFDSISEKNQCYFVFVVVVIFVIWPSVIDLGMNLISGLQLEGVSTISISGNMRGYTIVQFFVDIIIGMYLRRKKINPKSWILLVTYLGPVLIMTFGISRFPSLYDYCSIFTFISAISLFLLFNKLNFQSKVVNFISKSVFAIFCIHTLPVANILWRKYFITPEHISSGTGKMFIWTIISVAVMFTACLCLDIIVRYTFGFLKNKFCSKCPVILDTEE